MRIDSVFNADSESDISFELNFGFLANIAWKGLKMHNNCIQKPNCLDMLPMTSGFGVYQMHSFVASKKDYRMIKTRTR